MPAIETMIADEIPIINRIKHKRRDRNGLIEFQEKNEITNEK